MMINEEINRYNKLEEKNRQKYKSRSTDFERKRYIDYGYEKVVGKYNENISNMSNIRYE